MADRYLLESGAPDGYLLEDGSGVLILEAADAAPQRQSWFANGHAGVAMLGAAIGAAVIFSGTTIQPRSEQPKPQAAQWENATRAHDQPQPWFAKQFRPPAAGAAQPGGQFFARPADVSQAQPWYAKPFFAPAVVAAQPIKPFFVAPQQWPEQTQPQFWKQQLDLVAVSAGQGTFSPQQDQFQPQPWFAKRLFAPAAAAAQPSGQWFARGQDDPTQVQPRFAKPFFAPAVAAPQPTGQWFTPAQADSSQAQPQVWRQQITAAEVSKPFGQWFVLGLPAQDQTQPSYSRGQFANVAPSTVQWFATRQDDPTQRQPAYRGQFPTSQAADTPATRPWFARPQDDSTQIAPVVFTLGASLIPSQPTPPPVPDGGASGLGDYASAVIAKRRQAELDQQLTRQRQAEEVAAEAVAEHERALTRAKSEKTKDRERERLDKAQEQQAEQARLVELIAQELAALMLAAPASPDPMLAQFDEEEELLLLLVLR